MCFLYVVYYLLLFIWFLDFLFVFLSLVKRLIVFLIVLSNCRYHYIQGRVCVYRKVYVSVCLLFFLSLFMCTWLIIIKSCKVLKSFESRVFLVFLALALACLTWKECVDIVGLHASTLRVKLLIAISQRYLKFAFCVLVVLISIWAIAESLRDLHWV